MLLFAALTGKPCVAHDSICIGREVEYIVLQAAVLEDVNAIIIADGYAGCIAPTHHAFGCKAFNYSLPLPL